MKIRIKGNSVRLRLSRTDIRNFESHGYIEEKTEFIDSVFHYALAVKDDIEELKASFSDNKITVFVPEKIRKEWTTTERVGFDNRMKTKEDKTLLILIEKDFMCLDNTHEDQGDNFPNPKAVC